MTLAELIASARRKAFDVGEPGKLDPLEWIEYANDAQNEACRRARLLTDSTFTLAVTSGTASHKLDDRIIFVRRVKLASKSSPTPKIRVVDLDEQRPGWQTATGSIEAYNLDYQSGYLRWYRIPTATDTATITAVRMPAQMEGDNDEPEIPPQYHRALINRMLELYFSCDDEEVASPAKAAKYGALFTAEFGPPSTAVDEAWINMHHGYDNDEGLR